ncbi:aldo/keto reductase [Allomesorhizobium camelthorni]|uniref:aldo/keto reductase n=1 Tax=Allomesorhizobium camelthorni TaxID=475069 RepID=UPI001FEB7626|nr:aldo/keto reductase [Mesorhizobium camelthorni]
MDYLTFGRTGLQLSTLALGTGWGYGADPETAIAMLDAYAAAGGNFIDSADVYQFGQSEEILAKALDGRREDFVLATKFTNGLVGACSKRRTHRSAQPPSTLCWR